jgi:hypothetical protein
MSKRKVSTLLTTAIAAIMFFAALSLTLGCNRAAVANKAESPPPWNVKIVSDEERGEPLLVRERSIRLTERSLSKASPFLFTRLT